ncbi:MAG: multicopper oxidase family protein [Geminicoccaceae bacterium]
MLGMRGYGRWLGLCLLGAAMLAAPPAARAAEDTALAFPVIYDLPNPPVIASRNGVLRATLDVAPASITVRPQTFTSNVYNGLYTPPTLKLRRGDKVRLTLTNNIGAADVQIDRPQQTNVHFHGMIVTPIQPGDNVFVKLKPGDSYHYAFDVPEDHPEGLHWYHAHRHGVVEAQILSGMSGMIIVDGGIQEHYPELANLRQRVMVLKANQLVGQDPNAALLKTVNGYRNPPIRARPGELQIWNIGNLGADAFFNLSLDGHEFWVLERDGSFLLKPEKKKTLFLAPGARTIVAVPAQAAGRYRLRSLKVETGPQGDPNPTVSIGSFIVAGEQVDDRKETARLRLPPADIADIQPNPIALARAPIARKRSFVFSETADGNTFFINNRMYRENRVDTTAYLGDVEEWTIYNTSGELHVFHIHQLDFLVTEISGGGGALGYTGMRDVVNLPYAVNGVPGKVKLIVPFTNPIMVGEFVYHCHIVGHEDAGMMANIVVKPRPTLAEAAWQKFIDLAGLAGPAAASTMEGPLPPDFEALLPENRCDPAEEAALPLPAGSRG